MPFDAIPVELVGKIVKFVQISPSIPTLQSCALVSRAWHFASRPYIFHSIAITTDARVTELESLLDRESSVCSFVRTLTVRPVEGPVSHPSPWLARIVDRLPHKLPNVSTIRLVALSEFGEHITGQFIERFALFSGAIHLAILDSALNITLVFALASALPRLRHLHIGLIVPLPSLADEVAPYLQPPCLQSLHLDMGDMYPYGMRDITEWIMSTPSRETLRALKIVVSPMNMVSAGQFVRELGPQLNELDLKLDIRLPRPVEAEIIRTDISLATCTALQVLTLRHHNALSRAMMELLAEVTAPGVQSLTLGVLTMDDEAALPDFSVLQRSVPPLWMTSLLEERFVYSGTLSDKAVLAKIRRDLPELHAHGTLKVVRE